jgi:pectate lyase
VGGEYNLAGVNLSLTNGNVTIDGSPASTPVVLYNGMLVVRTNNVIVRHVRFRSTGPNLSPGDGDTDAVSVGVYNGSTRYNNIVFDHCEMIWGPDVSLTAFNLVDSTFQYCIISEGLFASVHPQSYGGPDGDADGHGLAANFVSFHPSGTERMTVYNNIVSTSQSRQPRFQNCTQVDVINNIFYNYHEGPQGAVYGLNLMNNYYKEGPAPAAAGLSSPVKLQWRTQVGGPMSTAPSQSVYLSGNHAANFTFAAQTGSNGTVIATTPRHTPSISGGNLRSATDAYTHVLANAGPRLPSVDATTQRLLNDVANGTGKYRSGYRWSTNTHFYPPVEHSW